MKPGIERTVYFYSVACMHREVRFPIDRPEDCSLACPCERTSGEHGPPTFRGESGLRTCFKYNYKGLMICQFRKKKKSS